MIEAGLRRDDVVLRGWIVRRIAKGLPPDEARAILERLTRDASATVRREALTSLSQSFAEDAAPHLERALLDSSVSVREIARFFLRDREIDFAAIYRNAIDATQRLSSAIAGLSEVGNAADAERIAAFLTHSSAIVRKSAVRAVVRLDRDSFVDRVADMLHDPSRAVSASARNALRKHAPILGRQRLESLFASSTTEHAQLNTVHLMAALSKWPSIVCLLHATAAANERVASLARMRVKVWNKYFNRSQAAPSRREIDEVRAALSRSSLDDATAAEIAFALRCFD